MAEWTGALPAVMIKIINHLHIIPRPAFRPAPPPPLLVNLRGSWGLAPASSISSGALRSCYSVEACRIFKKSSYAQAKPILAFPAAHRSPDQPIPSNSRMCYWPHSGSRGNYKTSPTVNVAYQGGPSWPIPTEVSDSLVSAIPHFRELP